MQTFLPYSDFKKCAQVLDRQRLGKQRVEVLQIIKAVINPEYGWQNHPAVNMWRNNVCALAGYGMWVCIEWKSRGYKDNILRQIFDIHSRHYLSLHDSCSCEEYLPVWLGSQIHLTHQSNLIRKNPEHYRPIFGPDVPDNLPYYWPI